MCTSQRNGDKSDRNRGSSSKSDKRHNRTWCQERSERQALVSSQLQKYASPLKITSGEDSDELPDLDTKPDTSSDVLNSKMTEGCGKTLCKERHFTDSLSFNPEMSFLGSCSMELKSEPIENIECKAGNIFKRRRSDRMSQEMQAGSAPVESEELVVIRFPELTSLNTNEKPKRLISDYFKTEPSESLDLDTIERKKFKNWRVKFLRGLPCFQADVMSEVCREFSSMQILMVESIAEDQNDATYFTHMLNLLQDFSVTHKPPLHLVDNVIRCGLVEPNDHKLAFQAYACVRNIWQRFPDLISFDWTTTQIAGDIIKRKLQAHGAHVAKREAKSSFEPQSRLEEQFKDEPTFQQAALYLQLQVFGLQRNLSSCVLADPKSVRMSLAYKNLSAINPVVKIKRLIYWLECCLIAVEHNYVPEQVFISNMENNNDSHDALQTKKDPERGSSRKDTDEHTEKGAPLLPSVTDVGSWLLVSLQDLLSMSVLVSRDHHEAARNLASELRHTYIYLPNLRLKKQLLQTVSCPLLCYHLVRLVLENHCNNTIFNSSFPASARELANSYFPALPPKSPMTPPPSPSDEEDAPSDGHAHTYSMQSCEELAMLMFFITKSFVACRQSESLSVKFIFVVVFF